MSAIRKGRIFSDIIHQRPMFSVIGSVDVFLITIFQIPKITSQNICNKLGSRIRKCFIIPKDCGSEIRSLMLGMKAFRKRNNMISNDLSTIFS